MTVTDVPVRQRYHCFSAKLLEYLGPDRESLVEFQHFSCCFTARVKLARPSLVDWTLLKMIKRMWENCMIVSITRPSVGEVEIEYYADS